jgi:hypothetical protein
LVAVGLVAVDGQAADIAEYDDHPDESHGCDEEEAKGPFQRDAADEPLEEADLTAHPPPQGRTIGQNAAAKNRHEGIYNTRCLGEVLR